MQVRAWGAALLLTWCLAGGAAAETRRPDPATALKGLDAVINQALKDQKVPGIAVGVVVDDKVVLLEGYGSRDAEKGLPMTPDTMMPIASVTKQFTVCAAPTARWTVSHTTPAMTSSRGGRSDRHGSW